MSVKLLTKEQLGKLIKEKVNKNVYDKISDYGLSNVGDKKYYVVYDGKKINFGHRQYEDYTIHKDKERKNKFEMRWKNNKFINDEYRPIFWSYHVLW